MMIKLIMSLNLLLSFMLITSKSPIKSNLIILLQTIMITMLTNLINKTSWISFMIFILYISGLMIIFLYISSIAFNEMNKKNSMKLLTKIMMIFFIINFKNNILILENFNFNYKFLFEDNKYLLNMFFLPNNLILYFIMMILFFMLILIIWILKNNKGPLRQKF